MSASSKDFFNARGTLDTVPAEQRFIVSARSVRLIGCRSIKVMLESVLRNCDSYIVTEEDVKTLANYNAKAPAQVEVPFKLARRDVKLALGVPGVVDLAAMRAAAKRMGGDPQEMIPSFRLIRDRSLGAGRLLRHARRFTSQL